MEVNDFLAKVQEAGSNRTEKFTWDSNDNISVRGDLWEGIQEAHAKLLRTIEEYNLLINLVTVANVINGKIKGQINRLDDKGNDTGEVIIGPEDYRDFQVKMQKAQDNPEEYIKGVVNKLEA